jgi:phosphate transport system substrate-binding protein
VEPFAEKLAEIFMGSHPGVVINVQGGGSSAGIQAALAGAADIGTSSRELKPQEEGLTLYVISHDGIAVVVNPGNPVTALSSDQVLGIFSGTIRMWNQVGGPPRRITAITREEGSGTRGAFEELMMKGCLISDACLVQDSNGAVREIVASDPNAIGYISLGLVDSRVHAVRVDGAEATLLAALQGRYKLVRPFLFLTRGEPGGDVKRFIDYVLSPSGQRVLQQEGLVPVGGDPE